MFCTAKSRRLEAERATSYVCVVGAGYTFDITIEAAQAGLSYGVLTHDASGFYFVNEPYGYNDVLSLPRNPAFA